MARESKPKAKKKGGFGKFITALVATIVVFIVLVVLETGITKKYESVQVVVAKHQIDMNTDVTADNIKTLFETVDYDATKLPDGVIKKDEIESKLVDTRTLSLIPSGQVVTTYDVMAFDVINDTIKNAAESDELVEASFTVDSLWAGVAGHLQRGDVVNISIYDFSQPEIEEDGVYTYELTEDASENTREEFDSEFESNVNVTVGEYEKYTLENVYIKQVYDSSGLAIDENNADAAATLFTVVASQEQIDTLVEYVNRSINDGYFFYVVKTNDVTF